MPIIKSAVKRVRQTKSRTIRNAAVKRNLKTATRALDAALAANSRKNLHSLLSNVQSQLDISVKKHLIHKNKAARVVRHYAAAVKSAGGSPIKTTKPRKTATKTTAKKKPTKTSKAKKS